MLGEKHSLLNEFPQSAVIIKKLIKTDGEFAEAAKTYNSLDEEIRELELEGSPIDDELMHQKKSKRAALKDSLYSHIQKAEA
ncbi:YdcH family protein [Agaribacterium haliotis]|uniref:YdcH family protein n=1 Tax=Agaribacterium haliotis TaxID=2013869 RepID=UPI000BB5976E|nr:YdcH family protein [Agaribacterium haliotis]